MLAELIALLRFERILFDHAIELRFHTYRRVCILHAIVVVLYRVLIFAQPPPRVQVVIFFTDKACGSASCKRAPHAISARIPACKFIAFARGQSGRIVAKDRNGAVVRLLAVRLCAILSKVAVVGHLHLLGRTAPHSFKRNIASYLNFLPLIIAISRLILPIEELFAFRRCRAIGGAHFRIRAFGVGIVVRNTACAPVQIIGNLVLRLADHLRAQRNILHDEHGKVRGRFRGAFHDQPASSPLIAFRRRNLARQPSVAEKRTAIYRLRLRFAYRVYILDGNFIGFRNPFSVNGNVIRGHSFSVKVKRGAGALFIIIPATESKTFLASRRNSRRKIVPGKGSFIFYFLRLKLFAPTNEYEVIAITRVVELGAIIVRADLRTIFLIKRKSRYRILIFLGDGQPTIPTRESHIRMVRHIFPVQRLYIIVGRMLLLAALLPIEVFPVKWHGINIRLRLIPILVNIPSAARPLIADVRAVFSGNAFCSIFHPAAFFLREVSFVIPVFFVNIELHIINFPLIIHVYNRRPIAINGLLFNPIKGKSRIFIFPSGQSRLRPRSSLLGFTFSKGIVIIIRVFLPVNYGIIHLLRGPMSLQRQRILHFLGEVIFRCFIDIPAVKLIARARRRRFSHCMVSVHEYRRGIASAVRLEGNPVSLFHLGIQIDVRFIHRDRIVHRFARVFGIRIPSGNRMLAVHSEADVVRAHRFARLRFLRGDNASAVIMEEHVINLLELRIQVNRFILFSYRLLAEGRELRSRLRKPADKLLAIFRRRVRRRIQRIVIFDDLPIYLVLAIMENESLVVNLRVFRFKFNRQHANLLAFARVRSDNHGSQRVHWQHADKHDHRQQQRNQFSELIHVLVPPHFVLRSRHFRGICPVPPRAAREGTLPLPCQAAGCASGASAPRTFTTTRQYQFTFSSERTYCAVSPTE